MDLKSQYFRLFFSPSISGTCSKKPAGGNGDDFRKEYISNNQIQEYHKVVKWVLR